MTPSAPTSRSAAATEQTGRHSASPWLQLRRPGLLRSADVAAHAELFLIAAVATVLVTRSYLQLTGFPQVGGGTLHVAHMLWGGLLMLVALLVQLLFLDYGLRMVSAVVGGIGLGLFVDELGKFITQDNDYFYQPTIALIYIVFVSLFLGLRFVAGRHMTQVEQLSNVLVRMPRLLQVPDDVEERDRLRDLLRQCDPHDPLVASLGLMLSAEVAVGRQRTGKRRLRRLQVSLRLAYRRLVRWRWFERVLVALMLLQALSGLALILAVALVSTTGVVAVFSPDANLRQQFSDGLSQLGVPGLLEVAANLVSAAFVIRGAFQLRRSRAAAYESFLRATLVSIFFSQVFAFNRDQLWAVWMLAFQVFVASALHYLMRQERQAEGRARLVAPGGPGSG